MIYLCSHFRHHQHLCPSPFLHQCHTMRSDSSNGCIAGSNVQYNLTDSESQTNLIRNGDGDRPYMNIGLHDYRPGDIIPIKRKGRSIARNVALKRVLNKELGFVWKQMQQ